MFGLKFKLMEEVQTPAEQAAEETPETQGALEPVEEATQPETTEEDSTPAVDRAAFNCPPCKGDGLVGGVGEETRCPNCNGTGKV